MNTHSDSVGHILFLLQIPVHRIGYKQLCVAIPRFAQDTTQSLSKDIYPYVADSLGYVSWQAVERAIRDAIADAWENGNREVWAMYFPGCAAAPTNKRFIATLAEHIEKAPLP